VFARSLAECLALQLKDRNRYDPVIGALLENLDLLGSHNIAALRRVVDVEARAVTLRFAGAAAAVMTLTDVTDTEATLVSGAQNTKLFKDGDAWFIDVASMPQEAMSNPMMKQLGAQIGMIAGPMRGAAEAVAAKITAGEIADPGAAMQAFQQAMMGAMMKAAGGMMGGAQDVAVPNGRGGDPAEGNQDEPLP
jgi:hypothetical protein